MGRQRVYLAVQKVSGSQVKRRKGKGEGEGKGGFKRTGKAYLGEEQTKDPEWWSEEDGVWWSKGNRGKKGSSKGKNNLPEGDSRTYHPEKGQIMNITLTKEEAWIRREKEKKVPGTWTLCNDKEELGQ